MSNTPHWETSPLYFKDVESFVSAKAEILKHYNPTGFNFTCPLVTEKNRYWGWNNFKRKY